MALAPGGASGGWGHGERAGHAEGARGVAARGKHAEPVALRGGAQGARVLREQGDARHREADGRPHARRDGHALQALGQGHDERRQLDQKGACGEDGETAASQLAGCCGRALGCARAL